MPHKAGMTSAIILCGGLGTRLKSVVSDRPKSMAPIAGRPFLEWQIDYWIEQGIDHFVLAVGYRHESISTHFGEQYRNCPIDYVIESTPQGTGGAFLLAARHLAPCAPFLLLNGDTYFSVELNALREFAMSRNADWCFSLLKNPDTSRYMGIETTADGRVTQLQPPSSAFINGGVYWIQPSFLQKLSFTADKPLSLENEILPSALASGIGLFGFESAAHFIDIGLPADYSRAQTELPDQMHKKGNP